jgi:hypothetical protein
MIWSFAAPIAVVEALVPGRADRSWLGGIGLAAMASLYLAAAALFFHESVVPRFQAAPAQLIGTVVVVAAFVVAAFAIPRRSVPSPGRSWSGHPGWTRTHGLAVAGAPVLLTAAMAFAVGPGGDADYAGKYASNLAFLAGVIALLAWAWHPTRQAATTTEPERQRPGPCPSRT